MNTKRTYTTAVAAGIAALALGGAATSARESSGELAFVRDRAIYVGKSDGSGIRKVVRGSMPSWSPDGKRIVFVREVPGNADLYVADADGRNVGRITAAPKRDYTPAWSPDGRTIAFVSDRGGNYALYTIRPDGSGARKVPLPSRLGSSFTAAWSPDSRLLAFSSTLKTEENPEIYVVRPNGSGLRRLTKTKGSTEVLGDDAWPSYAPDGKRIAFSSNRTGSGAIWIMRADGTGQRRIADLQLRDDWAPQFSPDGRTIAFHSLDARGKTELYSVRPDGTGLRRLGIPGSDPVWRP